ncbi:tyrosine-type recombinase/integrase [Runella salmonicolor]|uniref:Site-specific integrase n=1 Tax=Runella salmonicolor TaxID=2950278 RepID=A0ABT1FRN2_9BACT|nr:phage integrase SAM-like domain-containing protein [Runella salmonicolor]MCP1384424.1 site-specific integrase [Runella salmonicolor]
MANVKVAGWWQTYSGENFLSMSKMEYPYKEAYLQKPGDSDLKKKWFVCFWVFSEKQGKLIRKRIVISGPSIETRVALADEIIAEVNEKLQKGLVADAARKPPRARAGFVNRNLTIKEAVEHFLALKEKTLKKGSFETYTSCANIFFEFLRLKNLEKTRLRDFQPDYAHAFTDWVLLEKRLSNKSHNKHKGFCSAVFNEFCRRKIITDNPFTFIRKLAVTQGKHRVFSENQVAEFKRLCEENADDGTWFFACFVYYTFMRPHQEARLIQIQDLGVKTIVVKETIAKTSRRRHCYIPPGLEKMLIERNIRSYPSHFYLFSYGGVPGEKLVSEGYWYENHKRYLIKMGLYLKDYDLYGWKHTGVTALFRATKDLKLVQEQCGHTDIKQTVEYLRDLGVFYYEGQIEKFPTI